MRLPLGRYFEAGAGVARIARGAENRDRVVCLSTDLLMPIATHVDGESAQAGGHPRLATKPLDEPVLGASRRR